MDPRKGKRKATSTPEGKGRSSQRQTLGVPGSDSEPPSLTTSPNGSPASKQLKTPPHGGTIAERPWKIGNTEWLWTECIVRDDTFGQQGAPPALWVEIDEGEDPIPVQDFPTALSIYQGVVGKDSNWRGQIVTLHLRRPIGRFEGVAWNGYYTIAFIFLGREGRSKVEEQLNRGIETNLITPTPA